MLFEVGHAWSGNRTLSNMHAVFCMREPEMLRLQVERAAATAAKDCESPRMLS